jgi:hypothetical protein
MNFNKKQERACLLSPIVLSYSDNRQTRDIFMPVMRTCAMAAANP